MIKTTWLIAAVLALPPVGAAPPAVPMTWQPCAGNPAVGCGSVSVPVDWSRPDGLGHGAAPRTDCTREHVLDYLTDRVLPARGTRCPASPW